MQLGALRALEFDRIVEAVRTFALTPMGDARLARLVPATDPAAVAQLLGATTETVRYLGANHPLPLRASPMGVSAKVRTASTIRSNSRARRAPSCIVGC